MYVSEEGMATHPSILAQRIPTDRGTWWATVHGVAQSQTRSPWTEEPGGLQSMGSHRVGHDWATKHTYVYTTFHVSVHPSMDTWVTSTSCGIFSHTVKSVAINMGVQISFLDPAFNSLGYTVDSWTTWVWTVLVHLYAGFLHHLQLVDSTDMHYRYRETQASKDFGSDPVDTEGQLYTQNCEIIRYFYF